MCKTNSNFEKFGKHCNSYIHCVPNVVNDDLNYVCHSYHDAHHRSVNFVKAKTCKTNSNFQKSENIVNLIYTVCAMSEMMIQTMFAIVNMMRITGVEISKKSKCVKQTAISKSLENTVNLMYTVWEMSEIMI